MKTAKKIDKKLGVLGSYTPERLVELLNSLWSDLSESSREIVEMIELANKGYASAGISKELAKKIEIYQLRPNLIWNPLSIEGWSVSWKMKNLPEPDLRLIAFLFEAGAHGELRSFRRCAWQPCSQWFFQTRADQLCHPGDCTEQVRRASPEYREKQRRIMRKRYWKEQARLKGMTLAQYERMQAKRGRKL